MRSLTSIACQACRERAHFFTRTEDFSCTERRILRSESRPEILHRIFDCDVVHRHDDDAQRYTRPEFRQAFFIDEDGYAWNDKDDSPFLVNASFA